MKCKICGAEYEPKNRYMEAACSLCLAKERIQRSRRPSAKTKLKACASCGKISEMDVRCKYCLDCAAAIAVARESARASARTEESQIAAAVAKRRRKVSKAHQAIIDVNARARANGISYGKEVALEGEGLIC